MHEKKILLIIAFVAIALFACNKQDGWRDRVAKMEKQGWVVYEISGDVDESRFVFGMRTATGSLRVFWEESGVEKYKDYESGAYELKAAVFAVSKGNSFVVVFRRRK